MAIKILLFAKNEIGGSQDYRERPDNACKYCLNIYRHFFGAVIVVGHGELKSNISSRPEAVELGRKDEVQTHGYVVKYRNPERIAALSQCDDRKVCGGSQERENRGDVVPARFHKNRRSCLRRARVEFVPAGYAACTAVWLSRSAVRTDFL